MIFLLVLALATTVALLVPASSGRQSARRAARLGLAAAMAVAGLAHWVMPTPFLQHLPPWTPFPEALILLSGGVEIAFGAALLLGSPWRRRAGLALAAYLVAVFPANVYVAAAGVDVDGQPGGAYPWLRLPLQVLFVAWALWSTDWHLGHRRSRPTSIPVRSWAAYGSARKDGTSTELLPASARPRQGHPVGRDGAGPGGAAPDPEQDVCR